MKHTVSKPVKFCIMCSGELVELFLQPLTFRRLIDITAALEGKELQAVLLDPTPLQVATIAYCMMNKADIATIEDFILELNDKAAKVNAIQKLYYMVTENNVQDGYTNYTSLMQAVNANIIASFPTGQEKDKKKVLKSLAKKNRWSWKKYLMLLLIVTPLPLMIFLTN